MDEIKRKRMRHNRDLLERKNGIGDRKSYPRWPLGASGRGATRSLYGGIMHPDDLVGLADTPLAGEISTALMELRTGARKVALTMPIGASIHLIYRRAIVGEGIEPVTDNEQLMDAWRAWADDPMECDYYGALNFVELLEQAVGHWVADGEAFCLDKANPEPSAYDYCLKMIEPGRISIQSFGGGGETGIPDGVDIMNGVGFWRADGRIAGYLVSNTLPQKGIQVSSRLYTSGDGLFYPKSRVCHVFERLSSEQSRGVSRLVPALSSIFHLSEFAEHSSEAARLGSILHLALVDPSFVFPTKQEIKDLSDAGGSDVPVASDYLGSLNSDKSIVRFPEDSQVDTIPSKFPDGTTSAGFVKWQNELIAAAVGIPYHRLTTDLSGVNYSSARVGERAFLADLDSLRSMFINQLVRPVWKKFLDRAEAQGVKFNRPREMRATFTKLVQPPIEPARAATAYEKLIANGVISRREAMRREGLDVEQMLREIEEEAQPAEEPTPQSDD